MARNTGTFNFASNFEVLSKAPLDAREVVNVKNDLIDPTTWLDQNNDIWLYSGITVSVAGDSVDNNGLYFLINSDAYTDIDNWVKLNQSNTIDSSGTISSTWQLNNGDNGVVLKDVSGNLEIFTFDEGMHANIVAGGVKASSLKIDELNGMLYALDGSVYASDGSFPLKAYKAQLVGNSSTSSFVIDHSLNTLSQSITIFDNFNDIVYPELNRGLNSDTVSFSYPPVGGENYSIIILGF